MIPMYLSLQSILFVASGFLTGADKMLDSDRILTASPMDVSPRISITLRETLRDTISVTQEHLGRTKLEFLQMPLSKTLVMNLAISFCSGWTRSEAKGDEAWNGITGTKRSSWHARWCSFPMAHQYAEIWSTTFLSTLENSWA